MGVEILGTPIRDMRSETRPDETRGKVEEKRERALEILVDPSHLERLSVDPKVGAFERVHAANHLAYGMVRCGVGLPRKDSLGAVEVLSGRAVGVGHGEVSGCRSPR